MNEIFFVVDFEDGSQRFLYFEYASQVDNWCAKYRPGEKYEFNSWDCEEDYYFWLENQELFEEV